jgi:hypothetical protein
MRPQLEKIPEAKSFNRAKERRYKRQATKQTRKPEKGETENFFFKNGLEKNISRPR